MAGEVDDEGWDEFGERIVSVGTCTHCGDDLDEWEIFVEPEIQIRSQCCFGSIGATVW